MIKLVLTGLFALSAYSTWRLSKKQSMGDGLMCLILGAVTIVLGACALLCWI